MKTVQILLMNIVASVLCLAFAPTSAAQEIETVSDSLSVPEGYELVDSLVYRFLDGVDTTLVGKDIFHVMPLKGRGDAADVEIYQSQGVVDAVRQHVEKNSARTITGYRVRIFFDNKQSARHESENSLKKFRSMYPDVAAYRTYTNPYFKVTVGDCRTRSEAMALLKRIKRTFPSAFVVKENIEYPVVDKDNAYVVDTVQVLRSVVTIEQ